MSDVLNNFLNFQAELTLKAEQKPEVIGLVFLGSSAAHERVDQYSDQDFFLIVKNGNAESFRKNLDWLPAHHKILISPRETQHGLKVVYQDGSVLEFAVFEDSELEIAAANDYLVALDKSNITARMAALKLKSTPKPYDFDTQFELFLSLIWIGVGRFRRGEVIAAEQHIKSYALEKLLGLIRSAKPIQISSQDSFNGFRRFEKDYPNLGKDIADR